MKELKHLLQWQMSEVVVPPTHYNYELHKKNVKSTQLLKDTLKCPKQRESRRNSHLYCAFLARGTIQPSWL